MKISLFKMSNPLIKWPKNILDTETFPSIPVIQCNHFLNGRPYAINQLIENTSFDLYILYDSPDEIPSSLINMLISPFEENSNLGCVLVKDSIDFFSCICINRYYWDKVGPVDLGFGLGYYDDVDWLMRMKQKNISTHLIPNIFPQEYGFFYNLNELDKNKIRNQNYQYFYRKWGVSPNIKW